MEGAVAVGKGTEETAVLGPDSGNRSACSLRDSAAALLIPTSFVAQIQPVVAQRERFVGGSQLAAQAGEGAIGDQDPFALQVEGRTAAILLAHRPGVRVYVLHPTVPLDINTPTSRQSAVDQCFMCRAPRSMQ